MFLNVNHSTLCAIFISLHCSWSIAFGCAAADTLTTEDPQRVLLIVDMQDGYLRSRESGLQVIPPVSQSVSDHIVEKVSDLRPGDCLILLEMASMHHFEDDPEWFETCPQITRAFFQAETRGIHTIRVAKYEPDGGDPVYDRLHPYLRQKSSITAVGGNLGSCLMYTVNTLLLRLAENQQEGPPEITVTMTVDLKGVFSSSSRDSSSFEEHQHAVQRDRRLYSRGILFSNEVTYLSRIEREAAL